jgi:hypothetical protein
VMAEATSKYSGKPLKYTVSHHRKPQHTHEDFMKFMTEHHIPLALKVFKKHGVIEYSVVSPRRGDQRGSLD